MLMSISALFLLLVAATGCTQRIAKPPGADSWAEAGGTWLGWQPVESSSQLSHRLIAAELRPDRVLLAGGEQSREWSKLSSETPTRVIEQFRVVPSSLSTQSSELQWMSLKDWEALALELHDSWRSVISERGDVVFVDIAEFLFLTHAVQQANCQNLVGPHGIQTLYQEQREGGCTRGWPLSWDEGIRAIESDVVDGVLTVDVVVHRCPLEGENTWWTGVSLYSWASIVGEYQEGWPTGHFKALGFVDVMAHREDCIALPLVKGGRRVDHRKLAELLSAQLHRRVSAHSDGLPRMDQPWPDEGLGHIND